MASTQIQRRAARELQQVRHDLVRTDYLTAAREIATGVAHELRNPLTSIKLIIQATAHRNRDRPLSDKQLQVLQDEIARIEATVQGFLDFTRAPTMYRVRHDVLDTLRRALNPVRTRAEQLGTELIEELPTGPTMVCGDPERLYQMFINLLLNSLEAMPAGGRLCVTVNRGESTCHIEFSHTGVGFPEHAMERLFEPFVTGKEQCYGLGLAVSRRIVEEHGGSISATNRPEGGAMFVVDLPLDDEAHESIERQSGVLTATQKNVES